jgi:hypothetical protein
MALPYLKLKLARDVWSVVVQSTVAYVSNPPRGPLHPIIIFIHFRGLLTPGFTVSLFDSYEKVPPE